MVKTNTLEFELSEPVDDYRQDGRDVCDACGVPWQNGDVPIYATDRLTKRQYLIHGGCEDRLMAALARTDGVLSEVFLPGIGWEYLLKDVVRQGAAFVPFALTGRVLERLGAELSGQPFQERQLDEPHLQLCYEEMVADLPAVRLPVVAAVGAELAWHIRQHRGNLHHLTDWQPNHVVAQRYRNGRDHITTHQDYARDLHLIAVFTVSGYARFDVLDGRQGRVMRSYETRPCSLVLLRAAGLCGDDDERPWHRVLPPLGGERISLAYRLVERPAS